MLFIDQAGNYWRHVMYAAEPTATVERVFSVTNEDTRTRVDGVVGSPLLENLGLRLLVPEDET